LKALLNTMREALYAITLTSAFFSCNVSANTVVDVSGADLFGNLMIGSFTYGDVLDVDGNYTLDSAALTYAGKLFDTVLHVNLVSPHGTSSNLTGAKSGYIFSLTDSSSNALTFRAYVDGAVGMIDTSTWSSEDQASYVSIYNTKAFERVTYAVPEPETYVMLLAGLGLVGFAARRTSRCVV
jgi:hypothetical protein